MMMPQRPTLLGRGGWLEIFGQQLLRTNPVLEVSSTTEVFRCAVSVRGVTFCLWSLP